MPELKRLAVYCGSATPEDPRYIETAKEVGRTLAERGIGVVYGGGRLGLMGAVADAALAAGGAHQEHNGGKRAGAGLPFHSVYPSAGDALQTERPRQCPP